MDSSSPKSAAAAPDGGSIDEVESAHERTPAQQHSSHGSSQSSQHSSQSESYSYSYSYYSSSYSSREGDLASDGDGNGSGGDEDASSSGSSDAGHGPAGGDAYLRFRAFPLLAQFGGDDRTQRFAALRRQFVSRAQVFPFFIAVGTNQGAVVLLPLEEGAAARVGRSAQGEKGVEETGGGQLEWPMLLGSLRHDAPICDFGVVSSSASGNRCEVFCIGDKSGRVTVVRSMHALLAKHRKAAVVDITEESIVLSRCFDVSLSSISLHPLFGTHGGPCVGSAHTLLLASQDRVVAVCVPSTKTGEADEVSGVAAGGGSGAASYGLGSFLRFGGRSASGGGGKNSGIGIAASSAEVKPWVLHEGKNYGRRVFLIRWCDSDVDVAYTHVLAWLTEQYVCLYDYAKRQLLKVIKRPESRTQARSPSSALGTPELLMAPSMFWTSHHCTSDSSSPLPELVVGWGDWVQEYIIASRGSMGGGSGDGFYITSNVFLLPQPNDGEEDEKVVLRVCGIAPCGRRRYLLLSLIMRAATSTHHHSNSSRGGTSVVDLVKSVELNIVERDVCERERVGSPTGSGSGGNIEFHIFDLVFVYRGKMLISFSHTLQLGLGFCRGGGEDGSYAEDTAPGFLDRYPENGTRYYVLSLNNSNSDSDSGEANGCVLALPTSEEHYIASLLRERQYTEALAFVSQLEREERPVAGKRKRGHPTAHHDDTSGSSSRHYALMKYSADTIIREWLLHLYRHRRYDDMLDKMRLYMGALTDSASLWEFFIYLMDKCGQCHRLAALLPTAAAGSGVAPEYYDLVLLRVLDRSAAHEDGDMVTMNGEGDEGEGGQDGGQEEGLRACLTRYRGCFHVQALLAALEDAYRRLLRAGPGSATAHEAALLIVLDAYLYVLCDTGDADRAFGVLDAFAAGRRYQEHRLYDRGHRRGELRGVSLLHSFLAAPRTKGSGGVAGRVAEALPSFFRADAAGTARDLVRLFAESEGAPESAVFHPGEVIQRLSDGGRFSLFVYVDHLLDALLPLPGHGSGAAASGRGGERAVRAAAEVALGNSVLFATLLLDYRPLRLLAFVKALLSHAHHLRSGVAEPQLRALAYLCRQGGCHKAAVLLDSEALAAAAAVPSFAVRAGKIRETVYEAVHRVRGVRLAAAVLARCLARDGGVGGPARGGRAEAKAIFQQLFQWVLAEDAALLPFTAHGAGEADGGGEYKYFVHDCVGARRGHYRASEVMEYLSEYYDVPLDAIAEANAGCDESTDHYRIPIRCLFTTLLECIADNSPLEEGSTFFTVFASLVDFTYLLEMIHSSSGSVGGHNSSVRKTSLYVRRLLESKVTEGLFDKSVEKAVQRDLSDCYGALMQRRSRAIRIVPGGEPTTTCAYCHMAVPLPTNSPGQIRTSLAKSTTSAVEGETTGVVLFSCTHIYHARCAVDAPHHSPTTCYVCSTAASA